MRREIGGGGGDGDGGGGGALCLGGMGVRVRVRVRAGGGGGKLLPYFNLQYMFRLTPSRELPGKAIKRQCIPIVSRWHDAVRK